MDDKLIDEIISKVMAQLKTSFDITLSERKQLIYIGESIVDDVVDLYGESYAIEKLSPNTVIDEQEGILLPKLSCTQIASIWNGLPLDDISHWAVQAILNQKKFFVHKADVELFNLDIKNKSGLVSRIHNYYHDLKSDGLLAIEDCIDNVIKIEDTVNCGFDEGIVEISDKLVTEKTIQNLVDKKIGKLVLSRKTIMTPLARDLLRTSSIQMSQE